MVRFAILLVLSTVSQREVDVLSGIAVAEGEPSQKVRDAVRAFVLRAMRGKRLAYGLIFEPIDPEVESTRLKYRRAIARVFETIIREGVAAGEFRELGVEVAATCLVGAFMEGPACSRLVPPAFRRGPKSSRIPSPISASPPLPSPAGCWSSSGPPVGAPEPIALKRP